MISATDDAENCTDFSDIGKDRKLSLQWKELMVKGRFSGNIEFANFLLGLYKRKLEPPFCMVAKSIQCEISVDECLTGVCTGTDHECFKPYSETQDGRTSPRDPVVDQLAAELQESEEEIQEDEIEHDPDISDEFDGEETEMMTFVNEASAMDESFSFQTFEGDFASNSLIGSVEIESQSQVDNDLVSMIKCETNSDDYATNGFEPTLTGYEGQLLETILETKIAANARPNKKVGQFCQLCNLKFGSEKSFAGHMNYAHVQNSNHRCKLCPQSFSSPSNLKRHQHTCSKVKQPKIARAPAEQIRVGSRTPVKTQTDNQVESEPINPPVTETVVVNPPVTISRKLRSRKNGVKQSCLLCSRFLFQHQIKTHIAHCHVEAGHGCPHCPQSFSCRSNLQRHLQNNVHYPIGEQRSSADISNYKCIICHSEFSNKLKLMKHARFHHKKLQDGGPQCAFCDVRFSSYSNLFRHQLICKKAVPLQKGLDLQRQETRSGVLENYVCNLCNADFESSDGLRAHELECSLIAAVDEQDPGLQPIASVVQNGAEGNQNGFEKEYGQVNFWAKECDVCHTKAKSYRLLKKHFIYSERCLKGTKKYSKFVEHFRNGVFECKVCNKKYTLRTSLNRHKLEKHNVGQSSEQGSILDKTDPLVQYQNDQSSYECLECGQRFNGLQELVLHAQEKHPEDEVGDQAGIEPVMSTYGVSKQSFRVEGLNDHQCINEGQEPDIQEVHEADCEAQARIEPVYHACDVCKKQFLSRGKLFSHRRKQHSIFIRKRRHVFHKRSWKLSQWNQRAQKTQPAVLSNKTGSKPAKFECNICNKIFFIRGSMMQHKRRKHFIYSQSSAPQPQQTIAADCDQTGHEPAVHQCDVCSKSFERANNLTDHKRREHFIYSRQQYVYVKNKGFVELEPNPPARRMIHGGKSGKRRSHPDFLKHQCEVCQGRFKLNRNLKQHIQLKHREYHIAQQRHLSGVPDTEPPLQCNNSAICKLCTLVFGSSEDLAEHIKTEHKTAIANGGDKTGGHASKDNGRLAVLSDTAYYECGLCGKWLQSFKSHSQHVRNHKISNQDGAKERFECNVCHRAYSRKDTLVRHKKLHRQADTRPSKYKTSGEVGLNPRLGDSLATDNELNGKRGSFSCGECGKSYSRQSHLTNHMRVVHQMVRGQNIYHCHVCGDNFNRKQMFLAHKAIHLHQLSPGGVEVIDVEMDCSLDYGGPLSPQIGSGY